MHKVLLCAAFVTAGLSQITDAKIAPFKPSIPSGIYSSVRESKETGDRGGVEFRLYADARPAYVEAVVCESECNGAERSYIRQSANGFTFTWKNSRFPDDRSLEFNVSKVKNTVWIEGVDGGWDREKLKRINRPFGLYGIYK